MMRITVSPEMPCQGLMCPDDRLAVRSLKPPSKLLCPAVLAFNQVRYCPAQVLSHFAEGLQSIAIHPGVSACADLARSCALHQLTHCNLQISSATSFVP